MLKMTKVVRVVKTRSPEMLRLERTVKRTIELPMAGRPSRRRERKKAATMPRKRARQLAARVLAAGGLEAAARVLRWAAGRLRRGEWRKELRRAARHIRRGTTPYSIFNLDGNSKLPFAAFSALPILTCPGMGPCEGFCYSLRSWRYPAPFLRQLLNTLLLRHAPEVIAEAFRALPQGITLRLYVDGDFGSVADVAFWMGLLGERPDVAAYGYSKSWDELWAYGQGNHWPENYVLNLSSGGRPQTVTAEQMATLPIVRGRFIALPITYRPEGHRGNVGFARYDDPAYHAAVRQAARDAGISKPFSCPGRCGDCSPRGHVCGGHWADGITVVIGTH